MTAPLSPLGLAALELSQEAGIAVFPLRPRGKTPLVAKADGGHGHLDATTHPEQIATWWDATPSANIGGVPGSIDAVALDSDGQAGDALLKQLGVLRCPTVVTVTSRGSHRWYRLPRGMRVGNIPRNELDVRSSAGFVVLPPSIHPSGAQYRFENGSLDDIADAPSALVQWLREAESSAAGQAPESRSTSMSDVIATAKATGATQARIIDAIDYRIRRYLEVTGQESTGGRNNKAFVIARWLLNDFGAPEAIAWSYLREWNGANTPPLPERELLLTFQSAQTSGRREAGCAHWSPVSA